MKEATGELSVTVIAVVAIAAISALFIVFLYPQLKASIILNQACSSGPGYSFTSDDNKYSVSCGNVTPTNKNFQCNYKETGGGQKQKQCSQNT